MDSSATPEPQPAAAKPERSPFQFSLRMLLLLFVVLSSSLGVFGPWGIAAFVFAVGLAIYLHQVESLWSLPNPALAGLCLLCVLWWLPDLGPRRPSRRTTCANNLHQIALALRNYHQVNGCFPPAYVADKNGKPMHSWRALLLPYLDVDPLYNTYDFNEPWDGPNNKKLLASPPFVYACPSDPDAVLPGAAKTSYVAVVGPNAAWTGEKSKKLGAADFPGGASKTVMLVEVADAGIPWTEPRDLLLDSLGTADAKPPALVVSSKHGCEKDFFFTYERRSGANLVTADGMVSCLPDRSLSTEDLRTILQIGGYTEKGLRSRAALPDGECRVNWPNIAALAVWLFSVGTLLSLAVRNRKRLACGTAPPPAGSISGPPVE